MILRSSLLILLILLSIPVLGFGQAEDIVVIANKDVSDNSLEIQSLRRIFYGKKKQWSDKALIVPVMLKSEYLQERFIEDVLKETTHKFTTYWKQMVFSGRGLPPKTIDTVDDLINYISKTPGSITFISGNVSVASTGIKRIVIEP